MHDTTGKNNPLQWFSPFQESVLLCLRNTRSYENHHNSLMTKDIKFFDLLRFSCLAHDAGLID